MKASVAIQVLPAAENSDELIRIVDEVIGYIKSTGLNYYVGPCETAIEGEDYDELMDIVKECQHIAVKAGAPRVSAYIKLPSALPQFFSSLKITAAYSIIGAVISEWLGGFEGLGVYMTRVKKAFAFDKMFAVIFLISAISLLLTAIVNAAEKKCMTYKNTE